MNHLPSSANSGGAPFPGYPTIDVEGLANTLIRRFWIVAVAFGFFVTLALIYIFLIATKQYKSSAVVYVEPQRENVLTENIRHVRADDFQNLDALKSLEQSIISGSVILRVIEKHELDKDPTFIKPKKNGKPFSNAELVETLGRKVRAKLQRGTRLISVDVHAKTPERAQLLAQAFVDEFEALLIHQSMESTRKAKEILREESTEQLKRVHAAEDALQAFREKHATIPLEEGGIIEQKLNDLDKLLSNAKNEKLRLQSELDQLELMAGEDPERILEIGDYIKLEHISKLLLIRNQKKGEFVKIQRQYEPTHQTYIAFKSEIDGLDQQVRKVATDVGESIRKRHASAAEHEKKLQKSVDEQKQQVLSLDHVRKEFRSLKHAVDAAYDIYHKLLSRVNETDVTEGVRESHIRLVEMPLIPAKPAKPKKKLIVGLAGIFGLAVGTGLVLLGCLLDRSLRSRRQVEQTLGLSVLGEIPPISDAGDTALESSLVVAREPHSMAAESFRGLRMSLAALSPRSVMITSAMPGDGKSFCAANLGLLQAQLGYRTLLVDADFRRPALSQLLLPHLQPDAEKHLLEAKNICQKTAFPNLFLISCGQFAPQSSNIMNGEHFAAMLWEAYRSFDCIIIDSSPLGMVSDALNFARYADAVALVIRSGATQTADAQQAFRELRRIRAPLAGCILNDASAPNRARQAYYQTYAPAPQRPVLALQMSQA